MSLAYPPLPRSLLGSFASFYWSGFSRGFYPFVDTRRVHTQPMKAGNVDQAEVKVVECCRCANEPMDTVKAAASEARVELCWRASERASEVKGQLRGPSSGTVRTDQPHDLERVAQTKTPVKQRRDASFCTLKSPFGTLCGLLRCPLCVTFDATEITTSNRQTMMSAHPDSSITISWPGSGHRLRDKCTSCFVRLVPFMRAGKRR